MIVEIEGMSSNLHYILLLLHAAKYRARGVSGVIDEVGEPLFHAEDDRERNNAWRARNV